MGSILRRFLKNVNILNLALIAGAVMLWTGLSAPPVRKAGLSTVPPQSFQKKEESKQTKAAPPMMDFLVVAENNLFHPERRIPPEKKEEEAAVRPEIVLYGTMINEDMRVAFIEDRKSPRTTPGRGQRQFTVKKGDLLGGFTVTSVEATRITLSKGGETMVVPLTDPKKQRSVDVQAPPTGQGRVAPRPAPARPQPNRAVTQPAPTVRTPAAQQPAAGR